jgi:hypothetical protein
VFQFLLFDPRKFFSLPIRSVCCFSLTFHYGITLKVVCGLHATMKLGVAFLLLRANVVFVF